MKRGIMKNKIKAIWRIIIAKQYVVISDEGMTSTFFEKYPNPLIKTVCGMHDEVFSTPPSKDAT